MNPESQTTNYDQPVAYDANGNPLYAHPPKQAEPVAPQPTPADTPAPEPALAQTAVPQVVHLARPLEPMKPEVSPEVKQKHDRSKRLFPFLNLSEGEYIIRSVRRHPIGLIIPLSVGVLVIAFALSILFNYAGVVEAFNIRGAAADVSTVMLPILLFCVLIGLGMFVVYYVYVNNKFFLTNESVIQEIQNTLFSRLEQTVSLSNIEDASYTQHGIIQHLFNYGSIRLSTEGDETTYRFTFVANPKEHIARLNNAVEAFKNGRPVNDD
jgi:hypothetical protein